MFDSFLLNRPYLENEFEEAKWDESTGLSPEELVAGLKKLNEELPDLPIEISYAKKYAYLLDHARLQINPLTPFAAKFNIGIDYSGKSFSGFASSDILATTVYDPWKDACLRRIMPEDYEKLLDAAGEFGIGFGWTDFWHTVPDWRNILSLGIPGLLKRAIDKKEELLAGVHTEKQIYFLDGIILSYEAMLRMMGRMAEASRAYDIPEFTSCIENLMVSAPGNTYEVLQLAVLFLYFEEIGPERARSLGPIDRLYYPYFKNDLESGRYTKEQLAELFRYFFIHFTATKRYAQEPITLAGGDENRKDYSNDLTLFILDIYDEMNIRDPKFHVRYHENLSDAVFTKILDMIRRGNSSICILNDEAIFRGYDKIGVPRKDAADYAVLGCYEPIVLGKEEAEIGASWLNMAKAIEYAVNGGKDVMTGKVFGPATPTDFQSFEEFYQAFLTQLDYSIDFMVRMIVEQGKHSVEVHPSAIYSSTFTQCIEKATDVHEYPLEYNNASIKCFALGTVVDALMAVKKFVFEEKAVSFSDLRDALLHNWEGYEDLREKILRDKEKYGNGLKRPDDMMLRVTRHIAEKYACMPLPDRHGYLRIGTDSIVDYINRGYYTAATPDGRLDRSPLSKNLCSTAGMDRNGVTGMMKSLLKIDAADFIDSLTYDFVVHPSAVEGEKGLEGFKSIMRTFFGHGGFAMQGNIINAETLIDAKAHPENYRNLQIRLCGWNEYFVTLTAAQQDSLIAQCSKR